MARGRPRKTDPDDVLEASMRVFWEKGYEATSMSDLVAATGMAKPGLYANFGDKEALFSKALTSYVNERGELMRRDLETSPDPLSVAVRRFLDTVVASNLDKNGPGGCFFVNSLVESNHVPPAIEKLTKQIDSERRAGFIRRFRTAREAGEIPPEADADTLAEFFAGQVLALAVMARGGADLKTLNRFIDVAMTTIPNSN